MRIFYKETVDWSSCTWLKDTPPPWWSPKYYNKNSSISIYCKEAIEKWAKMSRDVLETFGIRNIWVGNRDLGYNNLLIILEFMGLGELIEGKNVKK